MKKSYLFYLITLFLVSTLWSCSQESDLDDRITIGTEHDGVYVGQLNQESTTASETFKRKVYLKKDRDEHVNITISYFPFSTDLNADLKLIDVLATIEEYGGPVTLSTEQNVTTDFGVELMVNLEGSIIDGVLSFTSTITPFDPTEPYTMQIEFSGAKGEDLSSACSILGFSIDSEYFIPASTHIFEKSGEIFLSTVKEATTANLTNLIPTISFSAGATLEPAADQPQDFSKPVVYKVTSEDGIYYKTYTVSLLERPGIFSFDTWKIANPNTVYEATKYTVPIEQYGFQWASSNALYAPFMHLPQEQSELVTPVKPVSRYGVVSTTDAYQGSRAALIETLEMIPSEVYNIPKITGGTLYAGSFETNLNDFDQQMHYGYPIFYKPTALKGYFKYQSGAEFHQCIDISQPQKTVILHKEKDAMRIVVFLYEVQDPYNDEEMLTLNEVLADSDKIIAKGELISSENKLSYTPFEVPLSYAEGKSFNYAQNYRIGFFFWSSSDGFLYSGAPGSKLWIDNVQIITD